MAVLFLVLMIFILGGCGHSPMHDPSVEKTEDDFLALQEAVTEDSVFSAEESRTVEESSSDLPPSFFQPLSVDLTHEMPVEEVLEILCQRVGVAYLVAPDLEGHVSYHVKDRTFLEVLEVICDTLNLTFSYDNGVLKVKKDTPFLKTYPLIFLSHVRQSEASLTNTTQVMAVSAKEGQGSNGSRHLLETKSTQDFWTELEIVFKTLLPPPSLVMFQRQASLVHIVTSQKNHSQIEHLLAQLQERITRQVLIEAKIVEVTLKDTYRAGIDWAKWKMGRLGGEAQLGAVLRASSSVMGHGSSPGMVNLSLHERSFQSLLHFMESFGTVRTLSSPRLTVLHNQNAFLRVAENQIFFDVKYERQFLSSDHEHYGSVVASHSQIQSVPVGLILSVHPVIRPETSEIILTLRPTLSRIVGTREDPSVQLMAEAARQGGREITSEIPIIAIREMDSVLKLQSGQAAVLGGLMIEGVDAVSSGFPGGRRHALSFLTSTKRTHRVMTELVIFIKATILEGSDIKAADRRLYKEFTKDPRPLEMVKKKDSP